MDLEGNSNSGTSAAFLERLRQRHSGPLNVICVIGGVKVGHVGG